MEGIERYTTPVLHAIGYLASFLFGSYIFFSSFFSYEDTSLLHNPSWSPDTTDWWTVGMHAYVDANIWSLHWSRSYCWPCEVNFKTRLTVAALGGLLDLTMSCGGEIAIDEILKQVRVSAALKTLCEVVQHGIFVMGLSAAQITSLGSIWERCGAEMHLTCTCVYFLDWCSTLCMCITALDAALETPQYPTHTTYFANMSDTICIATCTLHCLHWQLLTFMKKVFCSADSDVYGRNGLVESAVQQIASAVCNLAVPLIGAA